MFEHRSLYTNFVRLESRVPVGRAQKRNGESCAFIASRCTTKQILRFYETENFLLLGVNNPNNLGYFEDIGFGA